MLKLTFIPDGQPLDEGLVLCETSLSLAELNVSFDHSRVVSVEQLATALGSGAASLAQDFANWRHVLSLRARRTVDFSGDHFADPEAAFLFSLQQPQSFPSTGVLQIDVQGAVTPATTLWLLNVAVQAIRNKFEDLGIAPAYDYTFTGGLITNSNPFTT
jgi:hypothetical protein